MVSICQACNIWISDSLSTITSKYVLTRITSVRMLLHLLTAIAFKAVTASKPLSDRSFDFIVVGGGTSGLVVANRLSESPDVQVLIIEAGYSALDNDNSTFPELSGSTETIDWRYQSAPQIYAYDRIEPLPGGRGIGGSSLINGVPHGILSRPSELTVDMLRHGVYTG